MGSVLRNNYEDAAALSTNEDNEEMQRRFKQGKCYVFNLKKYLDCQKKYGLFIPCERLGNWQIIADKREVNYFVSQSDWRIMFPGTTQLCLFVSPEWCDCVDKKSTAPIFEKDEVYCFSYEKFKNYFSDYQKEILRSFRAIQFINGIVVDYRNPFFATVSDGDYCYYIRPEWCKKVKKEEAKHGKQ